MEITLDNKTFKVFITKKNNKNMYLRVKKDGIYITCNYFVTKGLIKSFIEREYICTKCGMKLDRDFNASINIMFEGLKLYMENYEKNYAVI